MKYRENDLVFRSLISKEDVQNTEQVLIDNGIEPDEVQVVLQAIGYTLLDLEIYNEDDEEEDNEIVVGRNAPKMPWD